MPYFNRKDMYEAIRAAGIDPDMLLKSDDVQDIYLQVLAEASRSVLMLREARDRYCSAYIRLVRINRRLTEQIVLRDRLLRETLRDEPFLLRRLDFILPREVPAPTDSLITSHDDPSDEE